MKRKILACILAATAVTALACGCNGEKPDPTPTPGGSTTVSSYTVTFDSVGGSAVASQTVDSGSKVAKPEDPEKAPTDFEILSYEFDGWYNGEELWDFANDVVTENITLTARYTVEYATKNY